MNTKITFPVQGMTCAACQAHVQRALQGTAGVGDATVDLMTARAMVDYDPTVTDPTALVAAVVDSGYGAELPTPGRSAFEDSSKTAPEPARAR